MKEIDVYEIKCIIWLILLNIEKGESLAFDIIGTAIVAIYLVKMGYILIKGDE